MIAVVCPYCRAPVEAPEDEVLECPGCGTPHHADCFKENGGCTVFGCTSAPAAEPKLSIGATELEAAGTATAHAPVVAAAAPPPPPPLVNAPPELPIMTAPLFSSAGYNNAPRPQPVARAAVTAIDPFWSEPSANARNRTTFLLLGVLLGAFGAHSFYAGYTGKGFLQLGITVLTFGFGGLMVWIWAVIDICTITTDEDGVPFRN